MSTIETTVVNRQRGIPVDCKRLSVFLERLTRRVPAEHADAWTVCLVSDRRMRELNRTFRAKDYPTDVLSFPDDGEADPAGGVYLGDVVIAVQTAARQAQERRRPLVRELESLALHGYLHLLGYDHETDNGRMLRLQRKLERELALHEPAS